MDVASDIGVFLIRSVLMLFLMLVMIRVLLQVARADFYNPISQAIVKITNPLLLPLRRIVPGFAGIDMAGIVLALLIQFVAIIALFSLNGFGFPPIANMVAWAGLGLIALILDIYWVTVLVGIVASFVAAHNPHPALLLLRQFTEPVLAPFRKILPDMGGLDLSPILFFLSLGVCEILLINGAKAVGVPGSLVLGF
ncbi:MAG: YggT family protein [Pseudomonadales bacterium]